MKLFNREEQYIGNLKYTLVANHYEEINGENILEFTTLDTRIEKGFRVVYKDIYGHWKEFVIKGIEEEKKDDGAIMYVFCESSFYETLGDYISDKRPSGQASIALMDALEPTRWEVGTVDNLGSNNTNFYRISAKEAVHKVAQSWQGEIRTRVVVSGNKITHRYVDLLSKRGDNLGKRFTYTKDIEEIKKIVHREDVITALYGYGKGEELDTGGYGRRIDFSEINNGKAYVENNDARLIWGRNNPDGSKSHVFGKVEFDDCEEKHELLLLTLAKLEEVSSPLVTYEAKVIDLKAYGLDHEGVELGDTVGIIDKDFEPELRLKARVIGINRDILEPSNNEIILGNFIPSIIDSTLEDKTFIDNFRNKQGIWDRSNVINADGSINANILNDLVDELNMRMNAQGGYVYISDDGKGLTTYDKPIDQDPTMAIQILGGSFRIANNKLPNDEWDWRTFGTGEGFVADFITTGTLDAGLIKVGVLSSHDNSTWINMVNGEFNLKNSMSYIDGTLHLTGAIQEGKVYGGVDINSETGIHVEFTEGGSATIGQDSILVENIDGSYTKIDGRGINRVLSIPLYEEVSTGTDLIDNFNSGDINDARINWNSNARSELSARANGVYEWILKNDNMLSHIKTTTEDYYSSPYSAKISNLIPNGDRTDLVSIYDYDTVGGVSIPKFKYETWFHYGSRMSYWLENYTPTKNTTFSMRYKYIDCPNGDAYLNIHNLTDSTRNTIYLTNNSWTKVTHQLIKNNVYRFSITLRLEKHLYFEDYDTQVNRSLSGYRPTSTNYLYIDDIVYETNLTGKVISGYKDGEIPYDPFFHIGVIEPFTGMGKTVEIPEYFKGMDYKVYVFANGTAPNVPRVEATDNTIPNITFQGGSNQYSCNFIVVV